MIIMIFRVHQTHYEQMGHIKGTVTVDGKAQEVNMPCVRDHSFGKYYALITQVIDYNKSTFYLETKCASEAAYCVILSRIGCQSYYKMRHAIPWSSGVGTPRLAGAFASCVPR